LEVKTLSFIAFGKYKREEHNLILKLED